MNFEMFTPYSDAVMPYVNYFRGYFDAAGRCFGIYVIWILVHYIAAHLYVRLCVSATIMGFLISPFLVPAPHCQALRWAVSNGACNINAMWVILSTWIVSKIVPFRNVLNTTSSDKEKEKEH